MKLHLYKLNQKSSVVTQLPGLVGEVSPRLDVASPTADISSTTTNPNQLKPQHRHQNPLLKSFPFFSERHKQTVTHRKARFEPAIRDAQKFAHFSLPKMRRRQLKTRNHVVEEKKHVNPNLVKKNCSVDDNFGPPKRYVVRSGMS